MQPLSNVDFGPSDAAAYDEHFRDKYISHQGFERLTDAKYNIITGGKGAGKTALIKGLHSIHKQSYSHAVEVSFEDFSFASIIERVFDIANTSGVSHLSLLINYWKYSLVVEAMKVTITDAALDDIDATQILSFLQAERHIGEPLSERLIDLADRQWSKLEKATRPRRSGTEHPGSLPAQAIAEAKNYPWNTKTFGLITAAFERYLERKGLKVLITLDGLDVLQVRGSSDRERIKLVFEGLIAATYQLSTARIGGRLIIKSMVPYDVYLDLDLRDRDKYLERSGKIEWDYDSLQEFWRKRISLSLEFDRAVPFDRAWQEVVPREVCNPIVGIAEDSYDYILRHTLYRPRQLQVHLRALSERYEGQVIRPEMIVIALQSSSMELVGNLVIEHKMTHPHLRQFLMHLRGKPNISTYVEFRRNIANILNTMRVDYKDLESEIDNLYRLGVIGLKETFGRGTIRGYQAPRRPGVAPYICVFQHTRPNPRFTWGLHDDDEVVIHPIVYDFCGVRVSEDYVVG